MNTKKIFTFIVVLFSSFVLFSYSNVQEHFLSVSSAEILPVDSGIGAVASSSESESNRALFEALSSAYSFEWTETWFEQSMKQSLSSAYSSVLSSILPAENFIMSKEKLNGDGSSCIAVRFADNSIIVFTLADGKIMGIN